MGNGDTAPPAWAVELGGLLSEIDGAPYAPEVPDRAGRVVEILCGLLAAEGIDWTSADPTTFRYPGPRASRPELERWRTALCDAQNELKADIDDARQYGASQRNVRHVLIELADKAGRMGLALAAHAHSSARQDSLSAERALSDAMRCLGQLDGRWDSHAASLGRRGGRPRTGEDREARAQVLRRENPADSEDEINWKIAQAEGHKEFETIDRGRRRARRRARDGDKT